MTAMLGKNGTLDYGSTAAYDAEMTSGTGTSAGEREMLAEAAAISEPLLLVMKLAITVISVLANFTGFSILIYGKLYRKHMYLITLIITTVDLLSSLIHLPVAITVGLLGARVNGSVLCTINAIATSYFTDVVIIGQMTFNIDRYIAIRFPYFYLNRVSRLGICVVWGLAAGSLFLAKVVRILWQTSTIIYLPLYELCIDFVQGAGMMETRLRYLLEWILNITGYVVIFFTSYQVSRIARQHHTRMAAQDMVSGAGVHEKDVSILASFQTVLLTSAAFVVTGLPKMILLVAPHNGIPKPVISTMLWLVYANGIINVIIYGYKFAEFRAVSKRMFRIGGTKVDVEPTLELHTINSACGVITAQDVSFVCAGVNPSQCDIGASKSDMWVTTSDTCGSKSDISVTHSDMIASNSDK